MSENLIKALLGMHSGWRYIILILLIAAIVYARQTASGKRPFAGATKKLGMFTMIAIDIQLLLGILLYYNFMQVTTHFNLGTFKHQFSADSFRNIAVDHLVGMLLAIICIHVGYAKAKKQENPLAAGKKLFGWYLFGLILILVSIPWPFLHPGRGWF
ncbi:MAG: hypothetical protein R2794_12560 [Chitinophagales bacterium]